MLNSYSGEKVTRDEDVGGFVEDSEGVIEYSYYDKNIASTEKENGLPKPTDEMIKQDTFEEWDFDDIWTIEEGSYPYFQWQDDENIPYPLE